MSKRPDWRLTRGADLTDELVRLWRRAFLPPLHADGWKIIPVFVVATLILFWIWVPLGWIGTVASIWCASLFRTPRRVPPARSMVAVSPVDGVVAEVGSALPPVELALGGADLPCVSVLLGPWDSHVVRAPAEGRLAKLAPGHDGDGEFVAVRVEADLGALGMALVARGFGRRVSTGPNAGAPSHPGEPLAVILFAGYADIFLPAGTIAAVAVGQRVVGGETVLADANPPAPVSAPVAIVIPPESE